MEQESRLPDNVAEKTDAGYSETVISKRGERGVRSRSASTSGTVPQDAGQSRTRQAPSSNTGSSLIKYKEINERLHRLLDDYLKLVSDDVRQANRILEEIQEIKKEQETLFDTLLKGR